ncbi:MAG: glycosyltransferase [Acidobacteria bacterium]|nr:glycosyltransferase [Acidobacteriota bacterium]
MRLAVLGPGYPFRGGIARTTTDLVLALCERGHEVHFVTPRHQYPRWFYPGGDDRDPDACRRVDGAVRLLDPLRPFAWADARRRIVALGEDAWLFPYWTWPWAPWWRFLLGCPDRPPAIAVVHNPADHDAGALRRLAARLVLGRCEALFTHAASLTDELRRTYPGVRVASFPLPLPEVPKVPGREASRTALGFSDGDRIALFLGLIRPYKGVDVLLDAAFRLPRESPWRVLVAGEPWGAEGSRLRRMVNELQLADRVRLDLRWIPEAEVARLLAAADLVVLPYRSGSQSAVAPLAFAHRVPVLCTRVGGLEEIVEDGVNGVVVGAGSAAALAGALGRLDDGALGRLRAGVEATSARLGRDRYAQALEQLVATVIEAP